jgi:hypothetical protein
MSVEEKEKLRVVRQAMRGKKRVLSTIVRAAENQRISMSVRGLLCRFW